MDLDKWHGVDFLQLEEEIYKTIEKLVEPRQPRWSRLDTIKLTPSKRLPH